MDLAEAVKRYKREGDYVNAVHLLHKLVEETEKESQQVDGSVESWPYLQLATIHRKLKDYEAEVEILERFARQRQSGSKQSHQLMDRLVKVYELAGQIEYREVNGVRAPYHSGQGQPVELLDVFTRFGAVVDTETTGRSRQDELIEIAIILFKFSRISGRVLKIVDGYNGLRYPRCKIHPQAKSKHGLSEHHLKGKTLDDERVMGLFNRADMVLAHNAGFDRRYITQLYPSLYWKNWHCTMNGVPWNELGFTSKGQDNLLIAHKIDGGRSHRAANDAKGLLHLLSLKNNDLGETYLRAVSRHRPLSWEDPPGQPERRAQSKVKQGADKDKPRDIRKLGTITTTDALPVKQGKDKPQKIPGWLVVAGLGGLSVFVCCVCSGLGAQGGG